MNDINGLYKQMEIDDDVYAYSKDKLNGHIKRGSKSLPLNTGFILALLYNFDTNAKCNPFNASGCI